MRKIKRLNIVDIIALILVIVGGINWGLVGLIDIDLVASLFSPGSVVSRAVYVLVGLAAIYLAVASTTFRRRGEQTV